VGYSSIKTQKPEGLLEQILPVVMTELQISYIPDQSFLFPKASHRRAAAIDIANNISM
jgi:hypothetical protein